MFKLWIVVLATLPCQFLVFWAVAWCTVDTLKERRIARAAAAEARALLHVGNSSTRGEKLLEVDGVPSPPTRFLVFTPLHGLREVVRLTPQQQQALEEGGHDEAGLEPLPARRPMA